MIAVSGFQVGCFICGTPSNRGGFEYILLGPDSLPGRPSQYLEKVFGGTNQESVEVEVLTVEGEEYVRFSRSLPIQPFDSQSNRGAYLSTGFVVTRQSIETYVLYNCLDVLSWIHGYVCSQLDSNRSLPVGTRLKDFEAVLQLPRSRFISFLSPNLEANLIAQALARVGQFSRQDAFRLHTKDVPSIESASELSSSVGSEDKLIRHLDSLAGERKLVRNLAAQLEEKSNRLIEKSERWSSFLQELIVSVRDLREETKHDRPSIEELKRLKGELSLVLEPQERIELNQQTNPAGQARNRDFHRSTEDISGRSLNKTHVPKGTARHHGSADIQDLSTLKRWYGTVKSHAASLNALLFGVTAILMVVVALILQQKLFSDVDDDSIARDPTSSPKDTDPGDAADNQSSNDLAAERERIEKQSQATSRLRKAD